MSKIGRRPINIGNVQVEIKGNEVHFKGKKSSDVFTVDPNLSIKLEGKDLFLTPLDKNGDFSMVWGLNRALLANKLKGADTGFEKQLRINGLGYKAVISGPKIQLSLGYSHKIDYELPKNVTAEVDKSGQLVTFKSYDKDILGQVCSNIRGLRPPEPYKGTGIQYVNEVIRRKAGKAKS